MKKLGSIIIAALALLFIQACNSSTKNDRKIDNTVLRDTPSKTVVAVEKGDAQFAVAAASGGLTEVELGKMAIQRGASTLVKNFGAMMVRDHSKANTLLDTLAKAKSITLPLVPEAGDQQTIDRLIKLWGKDFDNAYISDMIDDHENDIKTFEYASKNCGDPDLKAFAAKTLPVLKNHLDEIKEVNSSLK